MTASLHIVYVALTGVACALLGSPARAIDLTGVWASAPEVCDKVFVSRANKIVFGPKSDIHGSGFIIEGRRIRGRTARCNITRTKENAGIIHMVASCATDVMLSDVQFSLRVGDDNTIDRIFPGLEGIEMPYFRCPKQTGAH
jgi:hypothetical protein